MAVQITLCMCIGICAIMDILKRTIDVRILLLFLAVMTIFGCIEKNIYFENLTPCLCMGALLAVFSFVSNGEIGIGDVLLFVVIMFFAGFEKGICIIFLSIMFAFVAALYLVAVKKKDRKYEMPLVPFMFAAYLCSFFTDI